jgi:pantothenate kinase type III
MLMRSLNVGTSKISVEAVLGNSDPGASTKACVGSGLTLLITSLMAGLCDKAESLGVGEFLLTGGDAEVLMSLCPDTGFKRVKNLVLDGLQRLAEIGEV